MINETEPIIEEVMNDAVEAVETISDPAAAAPMVGDVVEAPVPDEAIEEVAIAEPETEAPQTLDNEIALPDVVDEEPVTARGVEPDFLPDVDELPIAIEVDAVTGTAHDDFDWNISKKNQISYNEDDRKMYLAEYDSTMNSVLESEIVSARVGSISGNDMVLDIGSKSDGIVSVSEFRGLDLKVGDTVEVYVERQEDANGQLQLSRRKAKILRAWESIVDSFRNGTILKGTVISKTKGGLIVDCGGLETFLPGSQIDIKPVIDYDQYVGKIMEFKVVKINEVIKNAVVSHKALIESDLAEQREGILAGLEKGQVLEGTVKNITDFGAFMDLGGVDGLLYITDISWGRIQHPSEVLQLNQKVNVVVLDFDENKKRISLGLKQLTPHPWEVLQQQVSEGSVIKGRVVNVEDYGAFLEVIPGVEGLIHISEVSWGNTPVQAKEYFELGKEVEAKVVSIDRADRKMSLSIKQLSKDPWSDIEERFPIGHRFTGTVKNFANFGIFVELEEGVGGMVHISDLSWTKRYNHPSEFTKAGLPIEVMVLDVDKDNRKISLGHKQLEDDPWDDFDTVFQPGSYHMANVVRRDDKGAMLQLPHGLEAFAPIKHIRKENNQPAELGDQIMVKVIEFNRNDKRVLVSHSRYVEDVRREADDAVKRSVNIEQVELDKAVKTTQEKVEKATLGDIAALVQLKGQFADAANEKLAAAISEASNAAAASEALAALPVEE